MIEDTLVHFKTKTAFNTELEAGNIKDTSVVFIKETLEIYTHGTLYSLKDVLDEAKQYTDDTAASLNEQVNAALEELDDTKQDVGQCVVHDGTITNIVSITLEEYDALETKDSTTLYVIIES